MIRVGWCISECDPLSILMGNSEMALELWTQLKLSDQLTANALAMHILPSKCKHVSPEEAIRKLTGNVF